MSELAMLSPRERGEAAIREVLEHAPYVEGTREHVTFVKGMVIAAGNALAKCRPTPAANASLQHLRRRP